MLLHVRESNCVLDSGFHTVDSGFQVLDSGYFVSGPLIPESDTWFDSNSLCCMPVSKAYYSGFHKRNFQDSVFHKQRFSRFQNLDFLTWGNITVISPVTKARSPTTNAIEAP